MDCQRCTRNGLPADEIAEHAELHRQDDARDDMLRAYGQQ